MLILMLLWRTSHAERKGRTRCAWNARRAEHAQVPCRSSTTSTSISTSTLTSITKSHQHQHQHHQHKVSQCCSPIMVTGYHYSQLRNYIVHHSCRSVSLLSLSLSLSLFLHFLPFIPLHSPLSTLISHLSSLISHLSSLISHLSFFYTGIMQRCRE